MMTDILQSLLGKSYEEDLSFESFCQKFLPHFFGCKPAPYHRLLNRLIDQRTPAVLKRLSRYGQVYYSGTRKKVQALIDVEPQSFGKSTRLSLAYPYALLTGRSRFTIIFAATQSLAEKLISDIRTELEENDELIQYFGLLRGSIWQNHCLRLQNGSVLIGKGAGQAVRGLKNRQHRPDLIICDDLLTETSACSEKIRHRMYQWLMRTVLAFGTAGFFYFS